MSARPVPELSDLDARERQLAESREEADRLEAENAALGGDRDTRRARIAAMEHADPGGYRSDDPAIRLERQLQASNAAVADLAIQNAILADRQRGRELARRRVAGKVAVALTSLGAILLVTLGLFQSVGLAVASMVVIGVGWAAVRMIAAIKPGGGNSGEGGNNCEGSLSDLHL